MSDAAREAWQRSAVPDAGASVPSRVRDVAGDAVLQPVWRNEIGGLTFRAVDADGSERYLKYGPRNLETSMAGEAERLSWAAGRTPVPVVLVQGADATHEWLVTRALPGRSAVDPRWLAGPAVAVRAIGRGLRAFHDALPVEECPFEWSVPARVANAARRGVDVPAALRNAPPIDRLVVCHGDACSPNTLLGDDGEWMGHVDLGALGVADRWADLAVAAMSAGWNYGAQWEGAVYDAYGIDPDPVRDAFYRALWNAT
ncbi:phosphotransferase [Microbacterium sp. RD1]|uniref:phosphotransferase n=1 Tax=Microbacterium sp. RD1 TaxID=3457313 RepID=UPI003FA5AD67